MSEWSFRDNFRIWQNIWPKTCWDMCLNIYQKGCHEKLKSLRKAFSQLMEANGWRDQARWFGLYIKEAVLGTDRRQCLDHSMFWWYGSFAQVETKQAVLGTDKRQCLEHVFWWYESLAQVDIKQAVLGTDKRQCLEQMFWWYESLAQVDIKQAVLGTNKRAVPRSHFFK